MKSSTSICADEVLKSLQRGVQEHKSLLLYLVSVRACVCPYSDASQCGRCGVFGQYCCVRLSMALSLSAQVCPGHMTTNHSLWNWICRATAIILTKQLEPEWLRGRGNCCLSPLISPADILSPCGLSNCSAQWMWKWWDIDMIWLM